LPPSLLLRLLLLVGLGLLLLLLELPLLGLGSLARGDSAGGLGGLGLSVLGLSVLGLSGAGLRSSCAFEMVAAEAPNKSARANVKTRGPLFVKLDFILSPPLCAARVDNFLRGPGRVRVVD